MSDTTTTTVQNAAAAVTSTVEENVERIRELNEKLVTAAKQSGNMTLDAYEKNLSNLVKFETKVADASQIEWVSALAKVHTTFVSDVSSALTDAARSTLK